MIAHKVDNFFSSVMSDSLWPHGLQHARLLCPSGSLLKLMSVESVMPSNHLILCHLLLLLPSIFPSVRVFSNESTLLIRWPKYWSFSFNISPSNEHPRLFSFRMDWLDLLAVQGTLKSLLQHHSITVSQSLILRFCLQQSFPSLPQFLSLLLTVWLANHWICSSCFPQVNCSLLPTSSRSHSLHNYSLVQSIRTALGTQSEQQDKNPCLCGGGENRFGMKRQFANKVNILWEGSQVISNYN